MAHPDKIALTAFERDNQVEMIQACRRAGLSYFQIYLPLSGIPKVHNAGVDSTGMQHRGVYAVYELPEVGDDALVRVSAD